MTNKMSSVIKIGLWLFIPFLLPFTGCGPSQQEMMARDRLANAKHHMPAQRRILMLKQMPGFP